MNSFTEKERANLGEFFDGTTPVVPNFLRFLYLDGGNEMLLLFIDKLVYTLNVVTEEVRISNFSIDESTLCKVFEASCKVKRLSLRNCKIFIQSLMDIDDKVEYKIQELEITGSFSADDLNNGKLTKFAQSLGSTKLTEHLKVVHSSGDDKQHVEVQKIFKEWGFKDVQVRKEL